MKPYSQKLISIFNSLTCRGGDLKQYKEFSEIYHTLHSVDASPLSFDLLISLMSDCVEGHGVDVQRLDMQPGSMLDKLFQALRHAFSNRRPHPDLKHLDGERCLNNMLADYFLDDDWLDQQSFERGDVIASDFSRMLVVKSEVPSNILSVIGSSLDAVEKCALQEVIRIKAYAEALRELHDEMIQMPVHKAVAFASRELVKLPKPRPKPLTMGMMANPRLDYTGGVTSLEYGKGHGPEVLPPLNRVQVKKTARTAIDVIKLAINLDHFLHTQHLHGVSLNHMDSQLMLEFWCKAKRDLEPESYTWLVRSFDDSYALAPQTYWIYSYIALYLDVAKALIKWMDRSV